MKNYFPLKLNCSSKRRKDPPYCIKDPKLVKPTKNIFEVRLRKLKSSEMKKYQSPSFDIHVFGLFLVKKQRPINLIAKILTPLQQNNLENDK
jgi:hypothetical protein